MSANPATEEEVKEIYALFGLAYYMSNVLEHGIANALACLELMEQRRSCKSAQEWEDLVDAYQKEIFAHTFGNLRKRLEKHASCLQNYSEIIIKIKESKEERDFIAHHFWREYAVHMYSVEGRTTMVKRLAAAGHLFQETNKELDIALGPYFQKYGFSDQALDDAKQELLRRHLDQENISKGEI